MQAFVLLLACACLLTTLSPSAEASPVASTDLSADPLSSEDPCVQVDPNETPPAVTYRTEC